MLFSNLHTLLKSGVTLNLILAAAGDDKIEVTVLPNTEKSSSGTQLVAKTFVATPQELDDQFPGVMAGYASANLSLKEQLEAVQKQAEEAAVAAKEEAAKKAASKPATPVKTAGKSAAPAKPKLLDDPDADDENESGSDGSEAGSADGSSTPPDSDSQSDGGQPQLISL